MPLVKMSTLLEKAKKEKYAVGSFSVANMEMVLGVIKAIEETKSPAIIQIAEVRLNHSPLELIGPLMVAAAKNSSVPVAVHFDHGKTEEKIRQALEIGFTSVMFDGSHLPFEENAATTAKIKSIAAEFNADCEGEIGCVGGSEDGSEDIAINCTSPSQAKEFYEKTGVDALAVAIGNAHGNYKETPKLRFDILEKTADTVSIFPCLRNSSLWRRRAESNILKCPTSSPSGERKPLLRSLLKLKTAWKRSSAGTLNQIP